MNARRVVRRTSLLAVLAVAGWLPASFARAEALVNRFAPDGSTAIAFVPNSPAVEPTRTAACEEVGEPGAAIPGDRLALSALILIVFPQHSTPTPPPPPPPPPAPLTPLVPALTSSLHTSSGQLPPSTNPPGVPPSTNPPELPPSTNPPELGPPVEHAPEPTGLVTALLGSALAAGFGAWRRRSKVSDKR